MIPQIYLKGQKMFNITNVLGIWTRIFSKSNYTNKICNEEDKSKIESNEKNMAEYIKLKRQHRKKVVEHL